MRRVNRKPGRKRPLTVKEWPGRLKVRSELKTGYDDQLNSVYYKGV